MWLTCVRREGLQRDSTEPFTPILRVVDSFKMDFCIGIDIGSQKTILVDQSADIVLTDTGRMR